MKENLNAYSVMGTLDSLSYDDFFNLSKVEYRTFRKLFIRDYITNKRIHFYQIPSVDDIIADIFVLREEYDTVIWPLMREHIEKFSNPYHSANDIIDSSLFKLSMKPKTLKDWQKSISCIYENRQMINQILEKAEKTADDNAIKLFWNGAISNAPEGTTIVIVKNGYTPSGDKSCFKPEMLKDMPPLNYACCSIDIMSTQWLAFRLEDWDEIKNYKVVKYFDYHWDSMTVEYI